MLNINPTLSGADSLPQIKVFSFSIASDAMLSHQHVAHGLQSTTQD